MKKFTQVIILLVTPLLLQLPGVGWGYNCSKKCYKNDGNNQMQQCESYDGQRCDNRVGATQSGQGGTVPCKPWAKKDDNGEQIVINGVTQYYKNKCDQHTKRCETSEGNWKKCKKCYTKDNNNWTYDGYWGRRVQGKQSANKGQCI